MRILIVMRNAWDDANAIGNTISNFFGGIDGAEFAAIYFRSAMPNNYLCKNYFQTSEIEVLRKWFHPQNIGRQFFLTDDARENQGDQKVAKSERKIVRMVQKYGIDLAYRFSDFLWYSEKWMNANLDFFIESFSPDLVFTFVKSAPQYYLAVKYLRKKYNLPLFSWIADDEYTGLMKKGARAEICNLKYILDESTVIRGCSEEICTYYHSIFGCNATPLYKSCEISTPIKTTVNDPITIVYAGNLLYGRLDIIRQMSDVVETLAAKGMHIVFEVYTNTMLLPQEEQQCFGRKTSTKNMGTRDYASIKERLASADIVVHVESFDEEQILKTKYSFSTKIIDYLQSGSVILAIGPEEVASMRYIRGIPGSYVISDLQDIFSGLEELLKDAPNYQNRAIQIREFARQHHNADVEAQRLTETIVEVMTGGV